MCGLMLDQNNTPLPFFCRETAHLRLNSCSEMGLFDLISDALGFKRREAKILVIGLDNSGKTTLINHLKPKKASTFEVTPTVGFQVEELKKNNINFTIFDMSGQGRYRTLWEHYYQDAEVRLSLFPSCSYEFVEGHYLCTG
jgi:GTPase SAR1 family protein